MEANKIGKLPKVLIVVHLTGQSCEMAEIQELCDSYGVQVIEDASHAIGGEYKNLPIGGCKHSEATIFSFHPVKIITSAEGGAVTTNCPDIFSELSYFDHMDN